MAEYVSVKRSQVLPRLPLEGNIDLTYRCNNTCRHCWLWLPANSPEKEQELSFDEIRRIADEARAMGCRNWKISGGEPMLRPDFSEIFDYLTSRSASYSLNTNGTLITPAIAQLLKRKGRKMVALYGATAEVYDAVTRHPGGFEQAMEGFQYLKEAGAEFMVQLVPMRANYHQWEAMVALAKSLSPHWRVGAPWLCLSACGSPRRNEEIAAQRLDPRDVVALDPPSISYEERMAELQAAEEPAKMCGWVPQADDRLLSSCVDMHRDFHIDPYGGMTFCCSIKDPTLRYDLRRGTFREAWDEFIPAVAGKVRGGPEYLENCGACENRSNCLWCPGYGYLEQRRFSAPVPYLCSVAGEEQQFRHDWPRDHRRYFRIAGITLQVESDLPFTAATFEPKFRHFAVAGPGEDTVTIRHHFEAPELEGRDLGQEIFRTPSWVISRKSDTWIYRLYATAPPESEAGRLMCVAAFTRDHGRGEICSPDGKAFSKGDQAALTLFPSDQLFLGPILAERSAFFLHSAGAILKGQGLLFAGHSEAGKSTMVTMLGERAEILCDDRVIVRRWPDGFKIHGTWSHGDVPIVSSASAPLRALLFLKKSVRNRIDKIEDARARLGLLLGCIVRPLVTAEWWEKTLEVVGLLSREAQCYELEFDKSGAIVDMLEDLADPCTPEAVLSGGL
jgi:sulfatase maturation enzyme AslB (radical SAM superfamily)